MERREERRNREKRETERQRDRQTDRQTERRNRKNEKMEIQIFHFILCFHLEKRKFIFCSLNNN